MLNRIVLYTSGYKGMTVPETFKKGTATKNERFMYILGRQDREYGLPARKRGELLKVSLPENEILTRQRGN